MLSFYRRLSEMLKYHQRLYGVDIKAFHNLIVKVKQLEKTFLAMSDTSHVPPVSSSSPVPQALHQVLRVVSPPVQGAMEQWVSY